MKRLRTIVPSILASPLVLAGCAAGADDAAYAPPATDRNAVVLPLDEFTASKRSLMEESYVRDLLVQECMAGHGIEVPAVRPEHLPTEEEGAARAVQYGIQTPEHAAEAGYRITLTSDLQAEYDDWAAFREVVESMSEDEYKQFDACFAEAVVETQDRLGGSLYTLRGPGTPTADALLAPDVVATLGRWRDCVVRGGLDVPVGTTPRDMATDAHWDHIRSSSDPWAEERRIAAIDTACREEVGYGPAYYGALFQAQVEVIESDYAELVETRDRIRAIEARLGEVIAELEAGR